MTAQMPEILIEDGEKRTMCSEPLGAYFELSGIEPAFGRASSALWRGYRGTWEIVEGRLYLVVLEARSPSGAPVTLATLFPDFPDRVFAHWFSGRVRVPAGGLLEYRHMAYASRYERDVLIDFRQGVETGRVTKINGRADASERQSGYRQAGFTRF